MLKKSPHANLRREGNADCCSRSEEISQRALGYFKLLQAGERDRIARVQFGVRPANIADNGLAGQFGVICPKAPGVVPH